MFKYLSQEEISLLPLNERAELKCLPNFLSIKEIADLLYSENKDGSSYSNSEKCDFINSLILACRNNEIKYYGNIDGWFYFDKNPYPLARDGIHIKYIDPLKYTGNLKLIFDSESDAESLDKRPNAYTADTHYSCSSSDCTINKNEFRRYIGSIKKWPTKNFLLKNWWDTDKDNGNTNDIDEKELIKSVREIWENAGKPNTRSFFPKILRENINKQGSPITAVYTAGKDAGIGFKLSNGSTGFRTKKTIRNWVSNFKRNLREKN